MNSEWQELERAIARYASRVAATARASLNVLRSIFPGASLQVYERRQSLPIGIAPESGGGAVFSVVLYPRWVRFFFLEGIELDDPQHRLEGSGNQVRSLLIDADARVFADPYIRNLIVQAEANSRKDLRSGEGRIVFKSRLLVGEPSKREGSARRSTHKDKDGAPTARHSGRSARTGKPPSSRKRR